MNQGKHQSNSLLKDWLFYLGGDQPHVSWQERLRPGLGALLGLMLVFAIAQFLGELGDIDEWLMASLGARPFGFCPATKPIGAALGFVAGNTVSALVGITVIRFIHEPLLAMPLAASFSILGMFALRCLNPPATAVTLIAVLGQITDYRYAFFPVMVDFILLVMVGAVYSNLTGKRYPNHPT